MGKLEYLEGDSKMALRRVLGFSDGELMRSDAKPCSRLMRQTAGIFSVGGALGFWILCRLHYGMFLYCHLSNFPCSALIRALLLCLFLEFCTQLGERSSTNSIFLFVIFFISFNILIAKTFG